ncbi:acyl-CoA dehydrogenase, partial [bacterium]
MLDEAIRYLREEVAPMASAIDRDEVALHQALDGMAARGLLSLKRPLAYGGPAMEEGEFRTFQMEIARASGALAFLQTQHQSAAGMIGGGDNEALKDEYLHHMHDGGKLVGIGFSQLRRPGPPLVKAEPVEGGYRIDGHVPWITGAGYFPEFLIGAQ